MLYYIKDLSQLEQFAKEAAAVEFEVQQNASGNVSGIVCDQFYLPPGHYCGTLAVSADKMIEIKSLAYRERQPIFPNSFGGWAPMPPIHPDQSLLERTLVYVVI